MVNKVVVSRPYLELLLQTEASGESTRRLSSTRWQRGRVEATGTESSPRQDVVSLHWGRLWVWTRSVMFCLELGQII